MGVRRASREGEAPAARSVGGGWRGPAASGRLNPLGSPALSRRPAVRTPGLASGLGKPATAAAGAREGGREAPTAQMTEESFLLPLLPPSDSGAFVFQVGSLSLLQVSDKPARTSPTHPGLSQTGEGAGGELSGQRLGPCDAPTGVWPA